MQIYACVFFIILLHDASSVLSTLKPWKTDLCPAALAKQTVIQGKGCKEVPNIVGMFELA